MIAMSVIDRIGRKTLLLVGSVGTAICLAGVSAIFFSHSHESLLVWLLVGYIAFFAFSQGAVIWVYLGSFPQLGAGKRTKPGHFSHWLMNALISAIFPLNGGDFGRLSVRLLCGNDGPAILRGSVCVSGNQRLNVRRNAEGNGKRLDHQTFPTWKNSARRTVRGFVLVAGPAAPEATGHRWAQADPTFLLRVA